MCNSSNLACKTYEPNIHIHESKREREREKSWEEISMFTDHSNVAMWVAAQTWEEEISMPMIMEVMIHYTFSNINNNII